MEIKCPNCQKIFKADIQQEIFIKAAINKKQRLIFIECNECYKDVPINPNDLLSKELQDETKNSQLIECPICNEGIINFINDGDEKFWGCGECGNIWFSKKDISTF